MALELPSGTHNVILLQIPQSFSFLTEKEILSERKAFSSCSHLVFPLLTAFMDYHLPRENVYPPGAYKPPALATPGLLGGECQWPCEATWTPQQSYQQDTWLGGWCCWSNHVQCQSLRRTGDCRVPNSEKETNLGLPIGMSMLPSTHRFYFYPMPLCPRGVGFGALFVCLFWLFFFPKGKSEQCVDNS